MRRMVLALAALVMLALFASTAEAQRYRRPVARGITRGAVGAVRLATPGYGYYRPYGYARPYGYYRPYAYGYGYPAYRAYGYPGYGYPGYGYRGYGYGYPGYGYGRGVSVGIGIY